MKSSLVLDLIRAHASGSDEEFRNIVDKMAIDEDQKGNSGLSLQLRKAIRGRPFTNEEENDNSAGFGIVGTPSINGLPILLFEPEVKMNDVILEPVNKSKIDDFIQGWINKDKLGKIKPVSRILMSGPPGCGKTMTAKAIAYEIGLTIAYVKIDSLISMYLGQTSVNIGNIFDFAKKRRCILFLDEFDAIASSRSFEDSGEMKRVLNSILQNMDLIGDDVVLIAATNMIENLDSAVIRRFEMRLHFDLPSESERKRKIELILNEHLSDSKLDVDFLCKITDGMSFADVEIYTIAIIRYMIIHDVTNPDVNTLVNILFGWKEPDIHYLRERGFTYRQLEAITGIPKSTLEYREKRSQNE